MTLEIEGKKQAHKLHDYIRTHAASAHKTVQKLPRPGHAGREAELEVSWSVVFLTPPTQPRGDYRAQPLKAWVVCARETAPPKGAEAVEWILLTNVPVLSAADALERLNWYERRGIVEEYHKAQKTGCGIEQLQFQHEDRPATRLS